MGEVTTSLEELTKKENSLPMNFGQLTALASTPVGQAIGIGQMVNGGVEGNKLLLEEM